MRIISLLIILITIISCNREPRISFSGDLEIGIEQSDSTEQDMAKSYNFQIDSGTFFYGYVDQLTIDMVVELKNDEGKLIKSFDGPAKGPEYFSFEIERTEKYTLDVKSFNNESGKYKILIKNAEPIANDPEKRVDQLMSFYSDDAPGASIGVMQNGKIIFLKSYGKANLTHNLDFESDMPSNIGSVTKQFTAMAILLLEKEGKLSLDDDVRVHIPELPDLGEVVKVRNILNHTNGWREVYNIMPIIGWKVEDNLLREEVLKVLQKQTELQATVGEEFNYNNSAYIIAAEIVERISGKDFPQFIKENIFEPLEMNNSYVRMNPSTIIPRATQGYSNGENGYIECGDLYAVYGAGGIYTTPGDLVKWMNNFESATVGGPDIIKKLVTPGILNNGDTMTYSLGLFIKPYKGLKRYSHGGGDIAHRAMMVYLPEIRSGVVTLSNNANFSTSSAFRIIDVFFKDYLEEDEAKKEDEPKKDNELKDEVTVNEETLRKYVGKFKAEEIGMVIEYKLEDSVLVAYPTGQPAMKMEPTSENSFNYIGVEASLVFNSDDEGNYNLATHTQGGSDLVLKRLPPFDPTVESLENYTGRYFSEEVETFYTLTVKDSSLTAHHRNMKDIILSPTDFDTFNASNPFIGEIAFKRNANGEIYAFTISNGRTKGILFKRD